MDFVKGFGFVTFLAKKDALEAKRWMDREIVDGRRLVVRLLTTIVYNLFKHCSMFSFQVNFAKPKQKRTGTTKEHSSTASNW